MIFHEKNGPVTGLSKLESVLLFYFPVWRGLSHLMTHRDLYLMSLTSKSLKQVVKFHLDKMRDIDAKLFKFVDDSYSFRMMLRDTKSIVEGEFPRSFFLGRGPPMTMDIFSVGSPVAKIGRWVKYLCQFEGYCEKFRFRSEDCHVSNTLIDSMID